MKFIIRKTRIFFWLLPIMIYGANLTSKKIIENLEKTISEKNTLKADFEETYIWELTGEKQTIQGEFILRGEDHFRITTDDQIIVSDGETIWMYNIPSHRVLIDRLVNSDDTILPRQILLKHQNNYRYQMIMEEKIFDHPCYVIQLTSETEDIFIQKVRVWVNKKNWIPQKIEQTDLNQNVTIYLLKKVELGIPVEDNQFRFQMPDSTEIIDMR